MTLRAALVALLASASASAQVAWGPPPGSFPVVFRATDPGVTFTISRDKSSPPFAECSGECVVPLFQGEYFLKLQETERLIGGRRRFKVEEASEVRIEPRTFDDRRSGVLAGSIGIGLLVAGAAALISVGPVMGEEKRDDSDGAILALGLCGFIGGAVLTPLGWVAAGRSAPALQVTPLKPR